jgi:hypothetical protein
MDELKRMFCELPRAQQREFSQWALRKAKRTPEEKREYFRNYHDKKTRQPLETFLLNRQRLSKP